MKKLREFLIHQSAGLPPANRPESLSALTPITTLTGRHAQTRKELATVIAGNSGKGCWSFL